MVEIYTDVQDEELIQSIRLYGLNTPQVQVPKWAVLRIALAKSLQMSTAPEEDLDRLENQGSQYRLEQVTGQGIKADKKSNDKLDDKLNNNDFTDAICALLSVFHHENLFDDETRFRQLLQRHIRRGLREIRSKWQPDDDFHDYLYQELFAHEQSLPNATSLIKPSIKTTNTNRFSI